MSIKNYSMGKAPQSWKQEESQTVTFIVTDDCNLRCKYCYVTHKSSSKKMNSVIAQKFIDLLLKENIIGNKAVILEFIGGEPLLEASLINEICDYFKLKTFYLSNDLYWNYRISICTNGINYSSDEVQRLIAKNFGKISITISLDGVKEKHDMQRVFPNGNGSFDVILQSVPLWKLQFDPATKVTFASADLNLLFDSITYLWYIGIKKVNANVVFEDVWQDGDDKILESQLKKLADYVIDNQLFNKGYYCTFFNDSIGYPYEEESLYTTYCGAGKILAVNADGNLFPCLRYYGHSLNNHPEWTIGTVDTGINMDKVRPFMVAMNYIQSDSECLNCPIATGCGFCQGYNYDEAETQTNFYRAKYICRMHKARVRANNYYFAKLQNICKIDRETARKNDRYLYIMLSDNTVDFCNYSRYEKTNSNFISTDTLRQVLDYASYNFYTPIFVHDKTKIYDFKDIELNPYNHSHIIYSALVDENVIATLKNIVSVFNIANPISSFSHSNSILIMEQKNIGNLFHQAHLLYKNTNRISLHIADIDNDFDFSEYKNQLELLSKEILKYAKNGTIKELNALTDTLYLQTYNQCTAGDRGFAVNKDGLIFTCPAFAYNGDSIGDIKSGITKPYSAKLYKLQNKPICTNCEAYQCQNCSYINVNSTNEVNVPPAFQCKKSQLELKISSELYLHLQESGVSISNRDFTRATFEDPISKIINEKPNLGYYKMQKFM